MLIVDSEGLRRGDFPNREYVKLLNRRIINSICRYQDMTDRQYSHQIVICDSIR